MARITARGGLGRDLAVILARRGDAKLKLSTTVGRMQPALLPRPEPADVVSVTVLGLPQPQGSKDGFVPTYASGEPVRKNGRILVNIVDNNKRLPPWRRNIALMCRQAMTAQGQAPLAGPLLVTVTFTVRKPEGAPKRRRTWPDVRPDVDKYLRALLDGMTDGGVYQDDGQVVAVLCAKCYPGEPSTAFGWENPLAEPGAHAIVKRLAWVPGEQLQIGEET